MIDYYVNQKTQTIHMVADFPTPRVNGCTHCGQIVKYLIRCPRDLRYVVPFNVCRRCQQLVGNQ